MCLCCICANNEISNWKTRGEEGGEGVGRDTYLRPTNDAILAHKLFDQVGVVFGHVGLVGFLAHAFFPVAADGEAEELALLRLL